MLRTELQAGKGNESPQSVNVSSQIVPPLHLLPAAAGVREDRLHVQSHVTGSVRWQIVQYLPHLLPRSGGIPSLDVDEGRSVNDDPFVEGASAPAPRPLQHFVGLPEQLVVEQADEVQKRARVHGRIPPVPASVPPSYHIAAGRGPGGPASGPGGGPAGRTEKGDGGAVPIGWAPRGRQLQG